MNATINSDIGIAKPPPILVDLAIRMNKTTKNVIRIALITLVAVVSFLFVEGQVNFPFKVNFRPALTSGSYVSQIVNTSGKIQSVKMTFYSPTFNRTKVLARIVNPHHFMEIGYLEGWAVSSGDTITLESNGVSKKFYIP